MLPRKRFRAKAGFSSLSSSLLEGYKDSGLFQARMLRNRRLMSKFGILEIQEMSINMEDFKFREIRPAARMAYMEK